MLAGLIQSPSRWDPAVDRGMSEQRWAFVLDGMVGQNWLPAAERGAQTFPAAIPPQQRRSGIPDNDRGHIVSAVRAELNTYGITETQVNQEGLQVTTTIDPRRQDQAVESVERRLRGQPANLRTALVSVDPRTGAVLAYYGGEDGLRLRLRPDRAPARVVVQAVRAARRAPAQPQPDRPRHDVRRLEPADDRGHRGGEQRGRELRELRPAHGDDPVDQHGLLPARRAGRPAARRRRGAPGGRLRAARGAQRRYLAG